ncbi:helix-turn-helix domain-containing protein [Nocardia salmonicida]|uniref:helix-turn-helix domain-containing protein n=1 Tax=Nocardia salmonicida TaxID=53431 RepID=UPI0033DB9D9C
MNTEKAPEQYELGVSIHRAFGELDGYLAQNDEMYRYDAEAGLAELKRRVSMPEAPAASITAEKHESLDAVSPPTPIRRPRKKSYDRSFGSRFAPSPRSARQPSGAAAVHAIDTVVLSVESGPVVLKLVLGGQLRRLREDAGLTREAAGDTIGGSHAKISRIELGRADLKERDLRDLLTLYGMTDVDEREQFLTLARAANQPGWWHRFNDVMPRWFSTYVGLEQAATTVCTYSPQVVPDLLQTPNYARALVELNSAEDADRALALRMERQAILDRPTPAVLRSVIEESALRRPLGGRQVLTEQLQHLLTMAELPNVHLQVLPLTAGGHAAPGGQFNVLTFSAHELPDIVYVEQLSSALYLDRKTDVDLYSSTMKHLEEQSLSTAESMSFLQQLTESMS